MAENDAQGEWTLPAGWVWTTIGEACEVNPRMTRPEQFDDATVVSFVPMAAVDDVSGVIVNPEARPIGEVWRGYKRFAEGDVIFAKITPCMENGKAAVARGLLNSIGLGSTEFHVLRPRDGILPQWIYHFVRQESFRGDAAAKMTGTAGQLRVPAKFMQEAAIPLAPLPEQRRIVAEIETQFTRLDAAVAGLERAQANIRRYKAAVLKAACEGRLVPTEAELARAEGHHYEPADQLLARILAERRAKWETEHPGKKYKEPAPPDMEDLPQLPEGWAYSLIEPLLSTSRSGMKTGPFGSLLKKYEHQPEGIPVLGIENIGPTGYVPGNKIFITEEKADQLSKYDVQPNDILISRSGTVGEVCIVPEGLGNVRFSTNLMRIVLTPDSMLPKFFRFLFNGLPFVLDQVSELCSGSTRDFLNQKILKSIVFPLPPLAEQRRIVAEVERRLSLVAALEASVEAALARAARLRQAVLKQAFEGRLVPQDPNDEPASVLLERIRAQREAEKKPKAKGSGKRRRETGKPQQLELF